MARSKPFELEAKLIRRERRSALRSLVPMRHVWREEDNLPRLCDNGINLNYRNEFNTPKFFKVI